MRVEWFIKSDVIAHSLKGVTKLLIGVECGQLIRGVCLWFEVPGALVKCIP